MALDPRELLERLLSNERVIPPVMKWKVVKQEEYKRIYEETIKDPYRFWEQEAQWLKWSKTWDRVFEGNPPRARWFVNGYIDAYYNIIGKHRDTWVWSKPAIIWEGEEGDAKIVTYAELDKLVERVASAMKTMGIKPGDWILLYVSPTLEAIAVMLAAVRIGAVFEPVFTGFGYYEVAKRIRDVNPALLVVTSGFPRRGKVIDTLSVARRAVEYAGFRGTIVVIERTGLPSLRENEVCFYDFITHGSKDPGSYVAESGHPLFGLHSAYEDDYRLIVHGTGGYLVQVYSTSRWIGLRPRDTYFCTVWPGWITGVSYVVFGPLMIGSTVLLYDGGPDYPSWDRWFRLIEDYAVTLFLTTSSALRILSKQGDNIVSPRNIDTLKAILVTAEPLDPETWWWTYRVIGTGKTPFIESIPEKLTGRIPVVNLYIQSEIGTFITGNLVNYTFPPIAPGSVGPPIPGFDVRIVNDEGSVIYESIGEIAMLNPWPALPVKYPEEYAVKWSGGYYRTGDYGYMTRDGYIYALGRRDNVAKVSGYRLSPGAIAKVLSRELGLKFMVSRVRDPERFEAFVIRYTGRVSPDEVKAYLKTMLGPIHEVKHIIAEYPE